MEVWLVLEVDELSVLQVVVLSTWSLGLLDLLSEVIDLPLQVSDLSLEVLGVVLSLLLRLPTVQVLALEVAVSSEVVSSRCTALRS